MFLLKHPEFNYKKFQGRVWRYRVVGGHFGFCCCCLGECLFILIRYHSAKQSKTQIAIPTVWAVFKQSTFENIPSIRGQC